MKRLVGIAGLFFAYMLLAHADGINGQFDEGVFNPGNNGVGGGSGGIYNSLSGGGGPSPGLCHGVLDLSKGCIIPGVGP